MQNLTAHPRESLTEAQVRDVLTGSQVNVTAGCEVLIGSPTDPASYWLDISEDLEGGEVRRSNYAEVHGGCVIRLARALAWGRDRIRLYMTLTNGTVAARFNLGVYVLTTPDVTLGETPVGYEVEGMDLLYLLQNTDPGDTYTITSGTNVQTAINAALAAANIGQASIAAVGLSAYVTPQTFVWAPTTEGFPSWLRIINDLLTMVGYRGLWADETGNFVSSLYQTPVSRPVEWTFDTADAVADLVAPDRTMQEDLWSAPNWWRFVMQNSLTQPVEGNGVYTVQNVNEGPSSQASLGRVVRHMEHLTALDHIALVAQGDRIVSETTAHARRFELNVDPLPIAGHFDIVDLNDVVGSHKCQVVDWTLPLDGTPGAWTLEAL